MKLQVSSNSRYLQSADGTPFFYCADTAWCLFHRCTLDEAIHYLDRRKAQGFNAIQVVVLSELDGLDTPNCQGEMIFHDRDPLKPNEAYFKHIDAVIRAANERGLLVALLPTWGKYLTRWGWKGNETGTEQDVIITGENAGAYATFLAQRYRDANIIWFLGGDRPARPVAKIWDIMAEAIQKNDPDHLIGFHPMGWPYEGGSSATVLHQKPWLAFNMIQSGHQWGHPNYNMIMAQRSLWPVKPVFDGEPRYENIPSEYKPDGRRMNSWQMRQAAWWSILSGSCAHTYGCNEIWQFFNPGRDPRIHANTPWKEALEFPGASHMGVLGNILQTRHWWTFEPVTHAVVQGQELGDGFVQAAVEEAGQALLAYVPVQKKIALDCSVMKQAPSKVTLIDPADASEQPVEFSCEGNVCTIEASKNANSVGDGDFVVVVE